MNAARALDTYRRTDVESRTPVERVVLLYDHAIRFAQVAREATAKRDIPMRRDAVSRTLAIVSELQSTLDMDRGGELAASLDRLYSYINRSLLDASFRHDPKPIDAAIRVLGTLREAWVQIAAVVVPEQPRVAG